MDLKVIKLNAAFGNNAAGEVCSFPAATADALIEQKTKIKGEDGSIRVVPGAVFLEKETRAHVEWAKHQGELRELEAKEFHAARIGALAAGAQKR